jgi:hypothetical protein
VESTQFDKQNIVTGELKKIPPITVAAKSPQIEADNTLLPQPNWGTF